LARVDAFVGAVESGARMLVIGGEPGIGKTTLWRAAVERCRQAGFRVLQARPAEEEMPLVLGALVDLFDRIELDVPIADEEDPAARGEAVLDALQMLATREPTIVAIDDLQWLDPASAHALRFALRRLNAERIGVLGALRPAGVDLLEGASTVAPDRYERLELGPLEPVALRRLLRPFVAAISHPTLHRIHEVSGGNPLYAIELARGLAEEDPRGGPRGRVDLPDSLQAAIAHRLETAPDQLTPVLEIVAVIGTISVADLRDSVPSELDALLLEAERHGFLTVEENRDVRFSHPLTASAVYQRMSPLARRALHARLAENTADPDVRARHLALSADGPDARAADLLEEAADRASRRGAAELAAELARHSLRLTPQEDAEGGYRRSVTEIEQLAAAGEASRALVLADRLVDTLPPGPRRARMLVRRSDLDDDDPATAVVFLRRALADAGEDEPLRAAVLRELAFTEFLYVGDVPAAVELARQALAIAERIDEPRLRAFAAADLAHLKAIAGTPQPDRIADALALEDEAGERPLDRSPRAMLGKQLRWSGDLEGARKMLEAGRTTAEFKRPYRLYDLALVECAAGNLATADRLVNQGLEAARDAGNTNGERLLLYPLALVEAWLGRAAEARTAARQLLERAMRLSELTDVVGARRVMGLLALSEGDAALASGELAEAARLLEEMGVGHPGVYPVLPDAIEAFAASEQVDAAQALLVRLEQQSAAVGSPWAWAVSERSRGILELAGGSPADAVAALGRAATALDRLGLDPDATRALLALGRAHLRAGRRRLAAETLAEARDRFAAMGAGLWAVRAAEELERAVSSRSANAGELTPAERRIAALVAQGRKNREIAQAMFVSVATVEAHLTRIYRKLEIRSRSELTRLVADGTVRVSEPEGARPQP
jgi:DNA-binding CsgD family transcriptional regulator